MMYASKNPMTRTDFSSYAVPTVADLRAKRSNVKGAGNRWTPIPHLELIEQIEAGANRIGLEVISEQFCVSDDGHDVFGVMRFNPDSAPSMPNVPGAQGITPELGFRHSNMQRMRLFGVHGERVGVCSNGMIVGDFLFGCKSTSGNVSKLDAPIDRGMEAWTEQAEDAHKLVESMVGEGISSERADRLMMEGARRGAYAWNQLGKIDSTYRGFAESENEYNEAFGERSLWSLYNAVTEVAKGWSPRIVERGLKGFPRVLTDAYGFELRSKLVEDAPEGEAAVRFDPNMN